jgi:sulfite exporter TauE/SafE
MIIAAFLLGFMGSFHCVGMCGPIALALPLPNNTGQARLLGSLLYNLGRATTYAIIGLLLGTIGGGVAWWGWQQALSISMGILLILSVLIPNLNIRLGKYLPFKGSFVATIQQQLGVLFQQHNYSALLGIGILNGLLPCGLVYMGAIGAVATTSPWGGALFMFFFGLGTLPTMLFLSLTGAWVTAPVRRKIRKILPVFTVLLGILFVIRGMNLGVPYLSPAINWAVGGGSIPVCH